MAEIKVTDELLKQYMPVVDEELLQAMPKDDDIEHVFSKRFERKMKRLIKKEAHSPQYRRFIRIAEKAAVFVLILTLGFASVVMSVDAYREKVLHYIENVIGKTVEKVLPEKETDVTEPVTATKKDTEKNKKNKKEDTEETSSKAGEGYYNYARKETDRINLGTSCISDPAIPRNGDIAWAGDYVYFGGQDGSAIKWRVLDTASYYGGILMRTDTIVASKAFDGGSTSWEGSSLRSWLNGSFKESAFSGKESAVLVTADGGGASAIEARKEQRFSNPSAGGSKVFCLSLKEATTGEYGFWTEIEKAGASSRRAGSSVWWLRSAVITKGSSGCVACINDKGAVSYQRNVSDTYGVSPAVVVNKSDVLFTSDINAKSTDIITDGSILPKVQGAGEKREWNLTLKSDKQAVEVTGMERREDTIVITYKDATTGNNQYLSAIFTNGAISDSGTDITHYGKIANTSDSGSGKAMITLPDGFDGSVYIFSEQDNGYGKTDYAGGITRLQLKQAEKPELVRTEDGKVKLTTDTEGADIYYTLNGNPPTQDSKKYEEPFKVKAEDTVTIKAIAVKRGMLNSDVMSVVYAGDILIKGIAPDSVYEVGSLIEFTVVGSGMSNDSPEEGDTRCRPVNWAIAGIVTEWEEKPYKGEFSTEQTGDYIVTITYNKESYKQDMWNVEETNTKRVSFRVDKKLPKYKIPKGLTAVYGQTLANVKLPEQFTFEDSLMESVGSAGEHILKVTYTPEDTDTYRTVTGIEVVLKVKKADLEIPAPETVIAYYGQRMSDVVLPDGYTFVKESKKRLLELGETTIKVNYNIDEKNYNTITDLEMLLQIEVCDASSAEVKGIKDGIYMEEPVTQPDMEVSMHGMVLTEGEDYTVSYENNDAIGTATVIITFQGNYTGVARKKFDVKSDVPEKGSVYTVDEYTYVVLSAAEYKGEVALIEPTSSSMTSASIPSEVTIQNHICRVVEIKSGAFQNNKKLSKVTIGEYVRKIGSSVFQGCSSLKNITISSWNITSVGSNTLQGISSKAKIKVPGAMLGDYEMVFEGKGQEDSVTFTT